MKTIQVNTQKQTRSSENLINFIIVFIILITLGFPGKYEIIIGSKGDMLLQYLSFGLQILLMLSAGRNLMEWKLIDLKFRYWAIYLMLLVFFLGSMSVTRYPKEQLITCIRFSVLVLFATWLAEYRNPKENLCLFCAAQGVFILSVMFFMLLYPDKAFVHEVGEHDFTGILATKNNAASEFSFGLVMQAALYRIYKDEKAEIPRWFITLLAAQLFMLLLCSSTGAIFYMIIPAFFVLFLCNDHFPHIPLGVLYIAGSVGFMITALTVLPIVSPLLEAIGKDATLTGRIPLWRQIIDVMTANHTFLGWGLCMFWRDSRAVALVHAAFSRYSFMGSMTTGSHNVLLEMWLDTGLIGVSVFFLAILVSTSQIKRLKNTQYVFCSAIILWFLLHGLLERAFSTSSYHTLFFFLALGTACKKEKLRGKRRILQEKNEI